jgi:hypothetical protein
LMTSARRKRKHPIEGTFIRKRYEDRRGILFGLQRVELLLLGDVGH